MRKPGPWFLTCLAIAVSAVSVSPAADPQILIKTIKSVGPEGAGNAAASDALRELTEYDATVLPTILDAFDDANPLAANWMRSAVETIADRELRRGKPLPAAQLERFILDDRRNPRARRLAYEWLLRIDKSASDRLISEMLTDPSPEFRRDAVQRFIDQGDQQVKSGEKSQAIATYRTALRGATNDDQVKSIAKSLKSLGVEVDLQRHFGFLTEWHVIGPFDNRGGVGLEAVYPPEREINFDAAYEGQLGEVSWSQHATDDDFGIFDIAKELENFKGSAMYATTVFQSDREREIEIRLGTPNSWKLWLNGEFLFGREEYHRGTKIDQYRVPGTLKKGANRVTFKICQNEQEQDWAQRFQFQLRVCDPSGVGVTQGPDVVQRKTEAPALEAIAEKGANE